MNSKISQCRWPWAEAIRARLRARRKSGNSPPSEFHVWLQFAKTDVALHLYWIYSLSLSINVWYWDPKTRDMHLFKVMQFPGGHLRIINKSVWNFGWSRPDIFQACINIWSYLQSVHHSRPKKMRFLLIFVSFSIVAITVVCGRRIGSDLRKRFLSFGRLLLFFNSCLNGHWIVSY